MWIFDAVKNNQHAGTSNGFVVIGIAIGTGDSNDALMGGLFCGAVQSGARFKTNGHAIVAAKLNNFLNAGTGSTFCHHDALNS